MKQQPNLRKQENLSINVSDNPSNVMDEVNNLKLHKACENKDISASIAKTLDVAKTNFSPIREIEKSIDTQSTNSAKTSTYDDLIELKDDLHYL